MTDTDVKSRRTAARSGRPRDPDVDTRVHAATLQLLTDVGYAATTIEAVARLAGVSRPTIYRRWSSRSDLVQSALFGTSHSAGMTVSGDLRRDITAWVDAAVRRLSRPAVAAALPGLVAEGGSDDRGRSLLTVRRSHLDEILEAGRVQGSVRDGVDSAVVFDLLVGALFLRVASGQPMAKKFREHLVDLVVAAVSTGRQFRTP